MTKYAERPSARVEIFAARPDQEPILANLLELYAHDFSEFHDVDVGLDGRFGYGSLRQYWSEFGRHPFLVQADGAWAGFVLVKKGPEVSGDASVWDMAEFFVLRRYRRRGIGTQIAHDVWRRLPGPWEVRVMRANVTALDFWAHALVEFTGSVVQPVSVEKAGKSWMVFAFESKSGGPSSA